MYKQKRGAGGTLVETGVAAETQSLQPACSAACPQVLLGC